MEVEQTEQTSDNGDQDMEGLAKSPIFCFLSFGSLPCVDCRLVSVRGLLPSLPKFVAH